MKRARMALCAAAALIVLWGACAAPQRLRKLVGEPCASTRQDCSYGLECRVPLSAEPRPSLPDGGVVPPDAGPPPLPSSLALTATAQPDGGPLKRCQYGLFAECSEEPGGPQCLSGQRCREGHCTVQCAWDGECGPEAVCRVGVCQRKRSTLAQCFDNRDCRWPENCFNGQCVTRTDAFRYNTDLDCGIGYRCINGRCQ